MIDLREKHLMKGEFQGDFSALPLSLYHGGEARVTLSASFYLLYEILRPDEDKCIYKLYAFLYEVQR